MDDLWLEEVLTDTVIFLQTPEFIISLIGIFLNIFHLIILTRKSMRNTSTNVLMIGIAFCDLFIMMFEVTGRVLGYVEQVHECSPPASYSRLLLDLIATALKDNFRRVSTWLGVLMASVRYFVIKNSLNTKYDHLSLSPFAWRTIFILLMLSSVVTGLYYIRVTIEEDESWTDCNAEFPMNMTHYIVEMDSGFLDSDILALQIFFFTDGILRIIPSSLFPILTFLLIRELKKANSTRKRLTGSSQKDHTTTLVILMTVTFMVAELPLGVVYVIQALVTADVEYLKVGQWVKVTWLFQNNHNTSDLNPELFYRYQCDNPLSDMPGAIFAV